MPMATNSFWYCTARPRRSCQTPQPGITSRYWDDAYVREYMSGLYKIVVNIVGESAGDVGQTTTDAQTIQANTDDNGKHQHRS